MSYSLLDYGKDVKNQAIQGLQRTAELEQRREMADERMKQAEKNQKISTTASGASIGAYAGAGTSVGGPWGAVIGAAVGWLASELF